MLGTQETLSLGHPLEGNLLLSYKPLHLEAQQRPQEEGCVVDMTDLVRICGSEQLPILIGGDFKIIRRRKEKNNENFDGRWSFMFNTIIESLDLREIELSGRKFTWANSLPNPTFEKLDRVLARVEWEQKFPLVTVQALSHAVSAHSIAN